MKELTDQIMQRIFEIQDSRGPFQPLTLEVARKFERAFLTALSDKYSPIVGLERGRLSSFVGVPVVESKILPPHYAAIVEKDGKAIEWFKVSKENG